MNVYLRFSTKKTVIPSETLHLSLDLDCCSLHFTKEEEKSVSITTHDLCRPP